MKKSFFIFCVVPVCTTLSCNATPLEPATAIANARANCGGISRTFASMKTMAQVNTAVTGVGTAAGAGATVVGLVKANVDSEIDELIKKVREREQQTPSTNLTDAQAQEFTAGVLSRIANADTETKETATNLDKRSKNLGNWRTGLLATNTATNIAGTIIAATNRTDQDLRDALARCIQSIKDLADSKLQAQLDNVPDETLHQMDTIINACRDYETLDIGKIDTKAKGATISSGIGIAVGAAGTITSAAANSDGVRHDDSDDGMAKEKNLNTASNVLAGAATVSSGVATVFNAQQIGAISAAQKIATQCSEALNQ